MSAAFSAARRRRAVTVVAVVLGHHRSVGGDGAAPPPAATDTRLLVESQTYAVEPGGAFTASLRLDGTATDLETLSGAGSRITVGIHEAISSAADIETAGDSPVVDSITVPGGSLTAGDATTATGELTATIGTGDASDGSLDVAGPGIYPVTIEVTSGSVVVEASTFVELVDPSTPAAPLAIAIVAAVDDPEGVGDIADVATLVDAPLSIALAPAALAVAVPPPTERRPPRLR